jgi:hypothetical protein
MVSMLSMVLLVPMALTLSKLLCAVRRDAAIAAHRLLPIDDEPPPQSPRPCFKSTNPHVIPNHHLFALHASDIGARTSTALHASHR